jgi:hypothetical protein
MSMNTRVNDQGPIGIGPRFCDLKKWHPHLAAATSVVAKVPDVLSTVTAIAVKITPVSVYVATVRPNIPPIAVEITLIRPHVIPVFPYVYLV